MNQTLTTLCSYVSQFMLKALWLIRYDAAVEKKLKILDIIRSLDLPNNPLDDIIDQVVLSIPTTHVVS